jgi:tRNA pseudouridine55 synthase
LYSLARAGKVSQDRPVRRITIHSIELQQFSASPPFPSAQIKIICSKGTYIRVLAESIAEKLDTVGHLIALERQASGQYTLDHAVTLETLQAATNPTIYLIDPPAKEL